MDDLLMTSIRAALEAGQAILGIYQDDFIVDYKDDRSPLTLADKASHRIIVARLERFGIPILSEEGRHRPFGDRRHWKRLWIVDPLDGTKEFVKKNGEFTVNVALVENGRPVLGVVFAPERQRLYFASQRLGAYKIETPRLIEQLPDALDSGAIDMKQLMAKAGRLPVQRPEIHPYTIVGSRSHATPELEAFVEAKRKEHERVDFIPAGSSLKICLVAEGAADIYPRLGPTMEWDTAAGQAIATAAGAAVNEYQSGKPLQYNKQNLLNPWFVVERKQV